MKSRSFFSALALAVVILLVVGAGGAYWLASSSPLSGKASPVMMPSAAVFMSKRSPIVASFFGNPDRFTSGGLAFTPPPQRRAMQTEFKRFQESFLAGTHLNYSRDIQPWVGNEITWALTAMDLDRDSENGQQPGYLVAIAIDKPEQAQESLERFWQKRVAKGADLIVEQYAGVPIVHASEHLASAVVGDRFVLLANHPKVLRAALNNAQVPGLNLSNSKIYQEITENLPAESLGLIVINLPQLATAGGNSLPLNPLYDRLVMTVKLDPQGLLADATLLPTAGRTVTKITQPALSAPVEALKFIPKGMITAAGTNVKQVLAQLETGWVGYEAIAKQLHQPIAQLEEKWRIDLSEDVLSWMPGEYALGMLPRSTGAPDWVFVTRQSPETTAGLERLNAIAQSQDISLGSVPLGETKITAWTTLQTVPKPRVSTSKKSSGTELMTIQAKVEGVHATVNGYEIFATSLEAMEQAIQAAQTPMADDRRGAIAALASPNNGYLFVDNSGLRQWAEKLPQVTQARLLLNYITSATVSNYGSDAQGLHNGMLIQIGKVLHG